MKISIHWFRRDLRLEDNSALSHALDSGFPVLPLFIFDDDILDGLPKNDPRVSFIYETIKKIDDKLRSHGCGLKVLKGKPEVVWKSLLKQYEIKEVYFNNDYDPYAVKRDTRITEFLAEHSITSHSYKDHVIFDKEDLIKGNGQAYTSFSHYKRKWLSQYNKDMVKPLPHPDFKKFFKLDEKIPQLTALNFTESDIKVRPYSLSILSRYPFTRDLPSEDSTSYLGPHLRFGTVSIRSIVKQLKLKDDIFLFELIWREFFMQILFHFPWLKEQNFRTKYDVIHWRNRKDEFEKWCLGKTGYPFIDAGMRQLNRTGYMPNRVRMASASFLVKHLLIDWRWGEAYFAEKLLDYELSSNNGNWQWAAGTGSDASPYYRVFNPIIQLLKFDKNMSYVRQWIPELDTPEYPEPMVEHAAARIRALKIYKEGIEAGGGGNEAMRQ
jgi:deoxyribodipyrimidine photo-lyase